MRILSALAALALGVTVQAAAAQPIDTLRVSIPQRGLWDTGIASLGEQAGIFKKHGLHLDLLFTSGGAESQQAVISGSVDIACGVGISGALAAYGKGAPLRVIGSEIIGSPDTYWYVPANSPVKTLQDLDGKQVSFSVNGSSSHAALLQLIAQSGVKMKPMSSGGMQATLTQVMTGQIDAGWSSVPFALDQVADGKIRIVAKGSEIQLLRGRTLRVNVANLDMLTTRKDALQRFMAGYRETIDWMYANPQALTLYAAYSGLSEQVVAKVRDFITKDTMSPDRVLGLEDTVADAVRLKFLNAPLTPEQMRDFVQIPH